MRQVPCGLGNVFSAMINNVVCANALAEGLWILYDVEETNKGPEATDIEPYQGEALE